MATKKDGKGTRPPKEHEKRIKGLKYTSKGATVIADDVYPGMRESASVKRLMRTAKGRYFMQLDEEKAPKPGETEPDVAVEITPLGWERAYQEFLRMHQLVSEAVAFPGDIEEDA